MTGSCCWVGEVGWEVVVGTGADKGDKSWEAGNSGVHCDGRGLQPLSALIGHSQVQHDICLNAL